MTKNLAKSGSKMAPKGSSINVVMRCGGGGLQYHDDVWCKGNGVKDCVMSHTSHLWQGLVSKL